LDSFSGVVAGNPGLAEFAFESIPDNVGQYTNTRKPAQEKHLSFVS
jgi:hypothetical protein